MKFCPCIEGWVPIIDASQGLDLSPNELDYFEIERGHLFEFAPGYIIMAHNLRYNTSELIARQLWRKFDVEAKTFPLGMEAGTVGLVMSWLFYILERTVPKQTCIISR